MLLGIAFGTYGLKILSPCGNTILLSVAALPILLIPVGMVGWFLMGFVSLVDKILAKLTH
jgi:hypothetical protein